MEAPHIPEASSPPSLEGSDHRGISERLRDFGLSAESSSGEIKQEAIVESHQGSRWDKLTTVDEYLQKEMDCRLTRFLLARGFADLHSSQDKNAEQEQVAYRQVALDRPEWEDHFPKDDSPEELSRWEEFKSGYPEYMRVLLDGLYLEKMSLSEAQQDTELIKDVEAQKARNFEVKQVAILSQAIRHRIKPLQRKNRDTVNQTASYGAPLTPEQQADIARNDEEIAHLHSLEVESLSRLDEEQVENVINELITQDALHDRSAIRRGLLLTEQMQAVVDRRLASLVGGGRLLLVGETGGAKTALAKHLAREALRLKNRSGEGRLVSGYGDLNAYQIIGKMELGIDEETKQTVTKFSLGAITRAMVEGVPLIIDEVNAIDPTVLKRLNEIVFLKPGDTYEIQENGGKKITVAPGFCMIMTANEKSTRYRGVNDISTELENRMSVFKEDISYPDSDVLIGEIPPDLYRLAVSASLDRWGNIPLGIMGIDAGQFVSLVRVAHKTQRMFSESAQSLQARNPNLANYASDAQLRDGGKPILQNFVIAPRTLVEIITELTDSSEQLQLEDILKSMLKAIRDDSDKLVAREIFKSEGFLTSEHDS